MTVEEFAKSVDLKVISGADIQEKTVAGCYIGDLLSLAMSKVQKNNAWITIQSNINIVAVASLCEAACIIICDGFIPDESVVKKAEEEEVTILSSDKSAYELAVKISELGI